MQRWVPLAAGIVLVLAAAGWFAYEFTCGDKTQEQPLPGQEAPPAECTRGQMTVPTFAVAATLSILAGGILAYLKPPTRSDVHVGILRLAYWPFIAALVFFAALELGGVGLYLFPLAMLVVLVALWPRDAGAWALGAGAALNFLSAGLQWSHELEAVRQPINSPNEYYIMPWWSLLVLVLSGVAAAASSPFWAQWWSFIPMGLSLGGWATLFLPETPPETLYFALPGMFLITAGLIRCAVARFQPGPVTPDKDEEPLYPELESKEPKRIT
ncbi:MAG: hypothetical protein HYT80_06550 [Euryarchaeota archaeon]|nr:hypothetical protein [Euryarchaeota archaeon]